MSLFETWGQAVERAVREVQPEGSTLFDTADIDGNTHTLRLRIGDKLSDPLKICRFDLLVTEDPRPFIQSIFDKLLERMPNG